MAERVGVLARDFAKPNGINGFAIISRNRNDLASSKLRRRFRPFAGVCRFFYLNDTRNGTRREPLGGLVPRDSRASIAWEIASDALLRLLLTLCRHGANGCYQAAPRFLDCSRSKHLNGQCTNGRLCFATWRSHIKVNRNGVRSWTEIALQR